MMFRPAGYSDSDEDSNFGYDFVYSKPSEPKPKRSYSPPKVTENFDDVLYNAVNDGRLDEVKRVLERDNYFVTGCLRHGWPLLLLACGEAQFEIVRFLLEEKRVDVNQAWMLRTALMAACESSRDPVDVYKVAILLLEFGAVINCKDNYGMTPLMFAIKNGHTEVVKLIIDQASLEATDNEGFTALFHAVNNHRTEIVEMLLKAGAATDVINRRGFTPKQEAEFKGYLDIVNLFPAAEDAYDIPAKYLYYSNYKDISQGEGEEEMPGYSQEIGLLLFGMNSERHLKTFAKENFDLMRFLTLTDEKLKELGFILPFERKKILHGLLKFHQHDWKKGSLRKFPKDHKYDREILRFTGGRTAEIQHSTRKTIQRR
ncbi:ankyrin repeat, SAM and basic leucine zipper domain-containing protein 1 isoform X2 [Toxorhynchites rutilus septentrionalis]|uniref:ankyrin repeat, SAM and basic leucine zipper domain-containing protein 1 isoform X2 n=1 Tax=Toxorhynchites rutilus septentrionalis TaxID=329112 RepID=UPI00247AA8A6|nr:ankyrin repeat, SAM and basic leucine zipper domain-containing protein 1 isoform X2 [Toxorhynchites rutilus septentrionalis]